MSDIHFAHRDSSSYADSIRGRKADEDKAESYSRCELRKLCLFATAIIDRKFFPVFCFIGCELGQLEFVFYFHPTFLCVLCVDVLATLTAMSRKCHTREITTGP